jgi:hypothetical protein
VANFIPKLSTKITDGTPALPTTLTEILAHELDSPVGDATVGPWKAITGLHSLRRKLVTYRDLAKFGSKEMGLWILRLSPYQSLNSLYGDPITGDHYVILDQHQDVIMAPLLVPEDIIIKGKQHFIRGYDLRRKIVIELRRDKHDRLVFRKTILQPGFVVPKLDYPSTPFDVYDDHLLIGRRLTLHEMLSEINKTGDCGGVTLKHIGRFQKQSYFLTLVEMGPVPGGMAFRSNFYVNDHLARYRAQLFSTSGDSEVLPELTYEDNVVNGLILGITASEIRLYNHSGDEIGSFCVSLGHNRIPLQGYWEIVVNFDHV